MPSRRPASRRSPVRPSPSLASAARRPPPGLATVLALVALVVGLAAPGPAGAAETPAATPGQPAEAPLYRIGPDDVLRIEVRGEPEVSGSFPVRPDGRITLPLAGAVQAVGRTPTELRKALAERLRSYIDNPFLTVVVARAQGTLSDRIRVLGDVLPPQSLPYREGMTALDLVTALGGLPETAAGDSAYLLRRQNGERQRRDLDLDDVAAARDVRLRPGDVVVIPEAPLRGDWRFDQFASVSQTFTDNVDLDPKGEKEAALITEVGPGISLQADLARVRGALNAAIQAERQSLNDSSTSVEGNLAGTGTVEWLERLLFTDLSASISQERLDSGAGTSASDTNDTNQRTVQTYSASPYAIQQFGRLAQAQLRYTANISRIDESDEDRSSDRFDRTDDSASNTVQHVGTFTLTGGPTFGRYSWTFTAQASELNTSGDSTDDFGGGGLDDDTDGDLSRRDVRLRNSYAILRGLSLIGDIGYQKLDSENQEDSFESLIWTAGFEWVPSRATRLFATVGKEDDDRTVTVEARQDLTERTRLTLRFDEDVATGQERLFTGLPQDPDALDDFDPRVDGFTIRDDVTRTRTLSATLDSRLGRNSLGLEATYETEEEDAVDGDETEERLRFGARFARPLARDLRFSLNGSYEASDFGGSAVAGTGSQSIEDDDIEFNASLVYSGLQSIDLALDYAFSRRDSTRESDEFTENAVTLTGNIRF
mgnify:CR=1 FL=1